MDTPIVILDVVARFLWLAASYLIGLGLAVFVHEIGHALAALLVTRQEIDLQMGRGRDPMQVRLGRLNLALSLRGFRYGFTRYERERESRGRQVLVALAGPAASLAAGLVWAALTTSALVGSWAWIAFLGLFVSNFRVLIVSLWPMAYRPDGPEGEVWLSDTLDIWRMWRGK